MAEHEGLGAVRGLGRRATLVENIGAYGVGKATVIALTTQLAVELGPRSGSGGRPAVIKTASPRALLRARGRG